MRKKEGRAAGKKQRAGWVVEVDVKAVTALVVTVVMCVLCALCLFLFVRSFLKIRNFELVGVSRYDERDIVNASLLKRGDRLYDLDLDEVEAQIGHGVGGVCPFALKEGVRTYLDVSLRRFDSVFPACGSANSAIELTCDELAAAAQNCQGWVDVCKGWREE